ncbi:MAG TPA: iron-sulfur cluster assembly accessory protein [Candidatus Limnocylindrales bacterium]|nr:iron-sulfur cluster assembly accessory protein [Candidatus Limnocylindrales bacterium]
MITVTDKAGTRIRKLAETSPTPVSGLRIKVVGGGCSGLQYKIELDAEKKGDKVFEGAGGGRVLVDRKSYLYLVDTVVDYAESLQNAGFQIQNPNVKSTCGCGESFVV